MDEYLAREKALSTKLENQARTLAAINRKLHSLSEQRLLVRRNFVRTSKNLSKANIDLQVALRDIDEVTEDQAARVEEILKDLASATETIRSLGLISQKGN